MELNVYSSEKFERSKWRFVILALVVILVLGICIYYKNLTGFILMFLLLGGYIYLGLINVREIKLKITNEGLILGGKMIPRIKLTGYVIEISKDTQQIKNIVLLSDKNHSIHTIIDTPKNIESFVTELNNYLPILGEYNQSTWEKIARILKL